MEYKYNLRKCAQHKEMNNMARIKITKNRRGVYLTVAGRRVKIPYKDILLLRECVRESMVYDCDSERNFRDFRLKLERNTPLTTRVTVFTPRKEYVGTVLDVAISAI